MKGGGGGGVFGPGCQPNAEPVYVLTHWPAAPVADVKIAADSAMKRDDWRKRE